MFGFVSKAKYQALQEVRSDLRTEINRLEIQLEEAHWLHTTSVKRQEGVIAAITDAQTFTNGQLLKVGILVTDLLNLWSKRSEYTTPNQRKEFNSTMESKLDALRREHPRRVYTKDQHERIIDPTKSSE